MQTIRGEIERVSATQTKSGKDKYGLMLFGKWYNGWDKTNYKKGDLVEITYTTTNYGNEIKTVREPLPSFKPANEYTPINPPLKQGESATGEANRQLTITRLACLHYAALHSQTRESLNEDDVLRIARKFEKYAKEG